MTKCLIEPIIKIALLQAVKFFSDRWKCYKDLGIEHQTIKDNENRVEGIWKIAKVEHKNRRGAKNIIGFISLFCGVKPKKLAIRTYSIE